MYQIPLKDVKWTTFLLDSSNKECFIFKKLLKFLGQCRGLFLSLSSNGCRLCLSLDTTMATDTTKGFDLNDWYQAHLYIYQSTLALETCS
jgi:hypothetical protein